MSQSFTAEPNRIDNEFFSRALTDTHFSSLLYQRCQPFFILEFEWKKREYEKDEVTANYERLL
ncbi:hypothetical protein CSA57_11570 [candidate division KSB3 bacterium]|nr:MAG: hypothetical protein CSA57_11570 [candidate division KSB3 bacterium]